MKKALLAVSLLSLMVLGCKTDNSNTGEEESFNPKTSFIIKGTIQGGENQRIWLEEMSPEGSRVFIDSIVLDDKGNFSYTYTPEYRSLYNIHTSDVNYAVLLPDCGETVDIKGQWDNFSLTYKVSGSPESILLWQMQQFSNDGSLALKDLVDTANYYDSLLHVKKISQKDYDLKRDMTDSLYSILFVEQQEYVCRFIEEHKGSLSTLIALYKPFNTHPLIDLRDPNCIYYYDMVLEGLQSSLPDNPHTIYFKNTTEHLRSAITRQREIEAAQQASKKISK